MTSPQIRKGLRIAIYGMLLLSAATTFLLKDRLWAAARLGDIPAWMGLVAPMAFSAFVLIYTADRWLLVRRHKYPFGRAFFQVGFAVFFLTILWPSQAEEFRQARSASGSSAPAARLLEHRDPGFRAAGCELAGFRQDIALRPTVERLSLHDPTDGVRAQCKAALGRFTGRAQLVNPQQKPRP